MTAPNGRLFIAFQKLLELKEGDEDNGQVYYSRSDILDALAEAIWEVEQE